MKRVIITLLNCLIFTFFITACSNEDVPVQENDSNDTSPARFLETDGVFVLNNGCSYQGDDGTLTYIDYTEDHYSNLDIYKQVNGKSLGGGPNDIIVYGEKVYIVGADENTIFILHVRTRKELKQVSTTDLLGDAEGRTPRRIAAYDGKVYFTTDGGYVASIDTTNFALHRKYQVGPYIEGLAFGDSGTLYVANSDWGYGNGSIYKIDLKTSNVTEIKNDKVTYPRDIVVAGDVLYVLDWGYYDDDWTQQLDAGVYMISSNDAKLVVPNATGMTVIGNMLYTYNDPLGGSGATYSTYDIPSNHLSTLSLSGDANHKLISPSAISVDPITGNIYIASRRFGSDTSYFFNYPDPSSDIPGFVNVYSNSGQFIESYHTGIEPRKIAFYHELHKVQPY